VSIESALKGLGQGTPEKTWEGKNVFSHPGGTPASWVREKRHTDVLLERRLLISGWNAGCMFQPAQSTQRKFMKILLWIIAIIFIIGLLTVTGVLKLIF